MTPVAEAAVSEVGTGIASAETRGWTAWLGPAISAAVLLAVGYQLVGLDFHRVLAMVPASPLFWLTFLLFYLAMPLSDWVIFRGLWHIPVSGMGALIRKTVSNELLFNYIGEVQFYGWARANGRVDAAPFGAVKDVAILSALAGNAVTLAVLACTFPLLPAIEADLPVRMIALSLAALVATSIVPMLWRRRVFSLPRDQLRFAFAVHVGRIVATTLLAAVLWSMVLPDIPLAWLMVLASIRLLVGRLPFMPNKDLVFAGLAVLLVGRGNDIAALMAMMAGLLLVAHMAFGLVASAADLAGRASE